MTAARPPGSVLAAVVAGASLAAPGARALDTEVRAETIAQGYQVRGPSGAPVLSFRRLTQNLSLGAVDRPSRPRGVTLLVRARIRIDSDFGSACDPITMRCLDELNRARSGDFAPLFARRAIDLPFAYLDAEGLFRQTMDLRVGRQLVIDPLGFFLFDGVRARVRVGGVVALEAYGGLESRSGFPLSSGRYERDGLQRANRAAWDPTLAPFVQDRALAGSVGVALESVALEPLLARIAWRRVWTAQGTVEEKAGGAIDLALSRRARTFAEAVVSVPQRTVATLSLGAEWSGPRGHRVGAEVARYRPVFDLTSIWASFWTDPTDDLRAHGELPLGRSLTVIGSALVRRYALGEGGSTPGSAELPDLYNAGGGLGVLLRRPRYTGSIRGRAEGGAVGSRGGVDALVGVWLLPGRLRIDVGASAWAVSDVLRPDRDGASVGVHAGLFARLGRVADVYVNLEDDANRFVGHRLRALAVLELRGSM